MHWFKGFGKLELILSSFTSTNSVGTKSSHKFHPEQPINRYPLKNYKNWEQQDKIKLKNQVKSLGFKMTEVLEKFAPKAHKNMSKTEPTRCNLGT
jgi:hypothetical protein